MYLHVSAYHKAALLFSGVFSTLLAGANIRSHVFARRGVDEHVAEVTASGSNILSFLASNLCKAGLLTQAVAVS